MFVLLWTEFTADLKIKVKTIVSPGQGVCLTIFVPLMSAQERHTIIGWKWGDLDNTHYSILKKHTKNINKISVK